MKLGMSTVLQVGCKYGGTVYLWTPEDGGGGGSLCQNYSVTKVP